jgi:predicted nucleic acid-binding protein
MNLLEQLDAVHMIFLDTAPVIYFVEKNPSFTSKVQPIFDRLDNGTLTAVVSPITLAECLVLPYQGSKPNVVRIFTDLLVNGQNILFFPIDDLIADKAAGLRARYGLALTDAFQIATSIRAGCDAFLTNDIKLSRVQEIPILTISE